MKWNKLNNIRPGWVGESNFHQWSYHSLNLVKQAFTVVKMEWLIIFKMSWCDVVEVIWLYVGIRRLQIQLTCVLGNKISVSGSADGGCDGAVCGRRKCSQDVWICCKWVCTVDIPHRRHFLRLDNQVNCRIAVFHVLFLCFIWCR